MLYQKLLEAAGNKPEKIAFTGPDATLTYAQFIEQIDTQAASLLTQGVSTGDRIAYLGLNSVAELALLFACAKIGAIFNPLNWRLTETELAPLLQDSAPKLLFADEHFLGKAKVLDPSAILIELETSCQGVETEKSIEGFTAESPVLLVYTSGATGKPKGAVHTHGSMLANARNAAHMHSMSDADHILTTLPFFHVGGLNIQTVPALLCGSSITFTARFDPAETLDLIEKHKPSLSVQVPATLEALKAQPNWAAANLSSLRAISTGSTDVPVKLIEAMEVRGLKLIQIYGSTETGPVVVYQQIDEQNTKRGSIGKAGLDVEVKIANPNFNARNQVGEICLKSDALASAYWPNKSLTANGWFHTGDFGYQDEDGDLWFTDRAKNMLISGGENIYPSEIERVISAVDGVKASCVVGLRDPRWGQVPVAMIEADDTFDVARVVTACRQHLAGFKQPKQIRKIKALPRNAMGKVVPEQVSALFED